MDYFLERIRQVEESRDNAYLERNKLVQFLTYLYPSGIKITDIPGWPDEWKNCVYIDTPTGQMSWHYHTREKHLFDHLGPYEKEWDKHTTEEKYKRLLELGHKIDNTLIRKMEI